jgi:PEP-CTERM motif-containing protein
MACLDILCGAVQQRGGRAYMTRNRITFYNLNLNWRTGLFVFLLIAAAFISNDAQSVSFGANAGPTTSQGDSCIGNPPGDSGFFSATFTCFSRLGEGSTFAHSNAAPGNVGASANAISFKGVNLGSESSVGVQAGATYSDSSGIFLPKIFGVDPSAPFVDVTLNVTFHATVTQSGGGSAEVTAIAGINGVIAAICGVTVDAPTADCGGNPVHLHLPVGQIISSDLTIIASASANASGQLNDVSANANGSDTFSFVIGGPVYLGLPDDITFNDPDAFIFNNLYLPPGADTPLPAALPLFASGLGALGLVGWRRKKKAA